MTDSNYPNQLDTDAEIIRVDNNITEVGGESINSIRSAVFQIEETLGTNPHGTSADVSARLNQSLNPDGTIKASALSTVGLVTLPIVNSMIASNAGIVESKIHLDYSTKVLRELIGALRVEHDSLVSTVQGDITILSRHVAHPSAFGRHRTSDIDGYIGTYISTNLQGIVDDLDTRIIDHVSDPIDAHNASAISFDDTDTFIDADEIQTAIEKLDALGITTVRIHQDDQHSNGILSSQKVYYEGDHGAIVVSSAALNTVSSGALNVIYTSPPSTLAQAARGDRIDITINSTTYVRNIDKINYTSGIVYFFDPLPEGGANSTAIIYRNVENSTFSNTLNVAIKHDSISGFLGGSLLQLIHPSSPYILSNGLDVRAINSIDKNIQFAWETGETGVIDVHAALQAYPVVNTLPSTWTPENLVIALNKEFSTNNYPLIAFTYGGEVGVAFDEPDGYLSLLVPADDAWEAFGLVGPEINYSVNPRRFYIDGYNFSGIRKIEATGTTDGTSAAIKNISEDLTSLGVGQTGIVRLKNHVDAGTYVFYVSTSNSLTIGNHGIFSADTNVSIDIYFDSFSVPITPANHTLYELFIDGYDDVYGEFKGASRLEYDAGGGSTASPQEWFNIVEVSRSFVAGSKRINFQEISSNKVVQLGDPDIATPTTKSIINPGEAYTLPTSNVVGHRFKLYDYNNVDYIEIEIADDGFTSVSTEQAIDITIYDRISEEKYIQVGQVLHDTIRFKHLKDRRLFGTVGRKDVRTDYSRDYVSYPRSLLRGNGVVYGCEVSGSLTVAGGQVLVDGSILSVEKTVLTIPNDLMDSTYNVFIDEDGVIKLLKDDQDEGALLVTPSLNEILSSSNKTILAQVEVDATNSVTEIKDLRRFVNNIDNKIELVVEENTITHGGFSSLAAAINWINAHDDAGLPVSRTIKIRGEVFVDLSQGELTLPVGVSLEGDASTNSASTSENKITLQDTGNTFLNVSSGCSIRNLTIDLDSAASLSVSCIGSSGIVTKVNIENCLFESMVANAINFSWAYECRIKDNMFNFASETGKTQRAIYVNNTMDGTLITGNYIALNSTTTNYGFYASTISDSVIENNTIRLGGTGWIGYASTSAVRTIITNNKIEFVSYDTNNIGFNFVADQVIISGNRNNNIASFAICPTITSSIIENNIFDSIYILVKSVTTASDLTINNNIIESSQAVDNLVYLTTAERVCFENNIIKLTSTGNILLDFDNSGSITTASIRNNYFNLTNTVSGIISSGDVVKFIIEGNIIETSASSVAAGNMIYFSGSADLIIISNNILENTGSGQGFLIGIYFVDSSVGEVNICKNIFKSFDYYSIYSTLSGSFIIDNNKFTNCGISIRLDGQAAFYFNISNNFIYTTVSSYSVYINQNTVTAGQNIFSNNFIYNIASTALTVVYLDGANLSNCIISNNVIKTFNNTSESLLYLNGEKHIVSNNIFAGENFTSSSPVVCAADDTYITSNLFDINIANVSTGTMITISGTGSTDYMNKGQSYTIMLPSSKNSICERDESGNSTFYQNGFITYATQTSYTASYNTLLFSFANETVPIGATINNISIFCSISSGLNTDVTFAWANESGSVHAATSPSSTVADTYTITPDSSPEIMTAGGAQYLTITATNSAGSWIIIIVDVSVNYTL